MTHEARALPRAGDDRLIVYLIGPGFGESQVVLLPGGRCMVVDSCMRGEANLAAELLRRLEVTTIDLFALTHADLDHVRGVPALLDEFAPRQVWIYPFTVDLRTLAARWLRQDAKDARLLDFARAMDALDAFQEDERLEQASSNHLQWPGGEESSYVVTSIAPTQHDQHRVWKRLKKLIERPGDHYEIASWMRKYFEGDGPLGDRPNRLSMALSVRWGERRVLLGGDVENGYASPRSGWKGAIAKLDRKGWRKLVERLDVIKVAHHGSFHSFHEDGWRLHKGSSTTAILTPFDRGRSPLPHRRVLRRLLGLAHRLGITCNARNALGLARSAGWIPTEALPLDGLGPVLAVALRADGSEEIYAGAEAGFFRHPNVYDALSAEDPY